MDVTFTFRGASLAGKSLVAFKTMEFEGAEYMVHADIDDVDQTVAVVDIATQARDGITNTGEGTCTENGVLIDTVAYTASRQARSTASSRPSWTRLPTSPSQGKTVCRGSA